MKRETSTQFRMVALSSITLFALALAPACKKAGGEGGAQAGNAPGAAAPSGPVDLQGAGATFPYPLYSKWISQYETVAPGVRINYQSIGSGGGIRQITEQTVDFGASDVPMTDDELHAAPAPLIHIPMTLGAVVITYNVDGVATGLKLDADVLTKIFLGTITQWNDPAIAALNPGTTFPADAITVAYRSDGSGTTGVFTGYLSAVSDDWKTKVGAGKKVDFPVGIGAKGNEGVAGQVKTTPGAIGYVELAYAKQTGLPYAFLQNAAGKFIEPTLDAVTAAAASVANSMPDDFRVSIVNAPGDVAYPIASFTYVLVYRDTADAAKGQAVARYLWWATHEGQQYGPALDYAPLPAAVVTKIEAKLHTLTAGGAPAL